MNTTEHSTELQPFQVDLRGIVEVLSHHLYSSPTVFVRELLQNAVDAVEARMHKDKKFRGKIDFEVDEPTRTITVTDNGIGLTRDQISEFVARVGASSKRIADPDEAATFIGQFGIGLLSSFIVADEIILLTKSIEADSPTLKWAARSDGTYSIQETATELEVGTRVILRLREDSVEYAGFTRLSGLVSKYGGCLKHDVRVSMTGQKRGLRVSTKKRLWSIIDPDDDSALEDLQDELDFRPLAAIKINDSGLGLMAVAYILPKAASGLEGGAHLLHLKGMFVADSGVKVVPKWAGFVRCVINSTKLSPTASREAIVENQTFEKTRDIIGERITDYLHSIARKDRRKLAAILSVHDFSFRQLALEDEAFLQLIIDLLPFETSLGNIPFGRHRGNHTVVKVAVTVDQFRSCAAIAAAQGITVFNGGYTGHTELLERAVSLDSSLTLELIDVRTLLEGLTGLDNGDMPGSEALLEIATEALAPFACRPMIRRFSPSDIPAVFAEGLEQSLSRSMEAATEESDDLWKDVLGRLDKEIPNEDRGSFLCFNAQCPLVERMAILKDEQRMTAAIRVVYVQSLLLGRQPLTLSETQAFTQSLAEILGAAFGGGR